MNSGQDSHTQTLRFELSEEPAVEADGSPAVKNLEIGAGSVPLPIPNEYANDSIL